MNRIDNLFKQKKNNILSIYFTAGYPQLNDTVTIIKELEKAGADMIEIGMPFSDPLADGPVIQNSSCQALKNGMSLKLLFSQLKDIREEVNIPLILMGYLNPVMQFGVEQFCRKCSETGIDGIILPDLPLQEYEESYQKFFEQNNLHNIFLITPETCDERVKQIDSTGGGFIYMVSSSSTTGAKKEIENSQIAYFERIQKLSLRNPRLIGFGISSHATFARSCNYASGAIIGSAFINALSAEGKLANNIHQFIKGILD